MGGGPPPLTDRALVLWNRFLPRGNGRGTRPGREAGAKHMGNAACRAAESSRVLPFTVMFQLLACVSSNFPPH